MKKILLSVLALLAFAGSGIAQNLPSYVPANGLVGWWPFNGNANDESGNNNNGTVNGATLTADRFGNAGKAYSFDGISNFIEAGNSNTLGITGDVSISFWLFKPTLNDRYEACIIKEVLGSTDYKMQINQGQNRMTFYTSRGNTNNDFQEGNWQRLFTELCQTNNLTR